MVSIHKLFRSTLERCPPNFILLLSADLPEPRRRQGLASRRGWRHPEARSRGSMRRPRPLRGGFTRWEPLARQFSAHFVDADDTRWELRLLPKPVYRYESTNPALLDGGMFAFVQAPTRTPGSFWRPASRTTDRNGSTRWRE